MVAGDSNEPLGTGIISAWSVPAPHASASQPVQFSNQRLLILPTDRTGPIPRPRDPRSRAGGSRGYRRGRDRQNSQAPNPRANRLAEAGSGTFAERRTLSKSQFPNEVDSMGTVDSNWIPICWPAHASPTSTGGTFTEKSTRLSGGVIENLAAL